VRVKTNGHLQEALSALIATPMNGGDLLQT